MSEFLTAEKRAQRDLISLGCFRQMSLNLSVTAVTTAKPRRR